MIKEIRVIYLKCFSSYFEKRYGFNLVFLKIFKLNIFFNTKIISSNVNNK